MLILSVSSSKWSSHEHWSPIIVTLKYNSMLSMNNQHELEEWGAVSYIPWPSAQMKLHKYEFPPVSLCKVWMRMRMRSRSWWLRRTGPRGPGVRTWCSLRQPLPGGFPWERTFFLRNGHHMAPASGLSFTFQDVCSILGLKSLLCKYFNKINQSSLVHLYLLLKLQCHLCTTRGAKQNHKNNINRIFVVDVFKKMPEIVSRTHGT